jgi:predicted branched-subunit amino acid permease
MAHGPGNAHRMNHPSLRNALGIGIATGAFGISFGAVGTAGGLSIVQTCALSLLMFTGASQYAFAGVIGSGGTALAATATALLLGTRNAFYGLRLSLLLRVRGRQRLGAAHFVIDETTAMALAQDDPEEARFAFWATGLAIYALWNLGTLVGALGANAIADPKQLGLDAAAPAAFLALLAPRLRDNGVRVLALGAAASAIVAVPFVPAGLAVLVAAAVAFVVGLR